MVPDSYRCYRSGNISTALLTFLQGRATVGCDRTHTTLIVNESLGHRIFLAHLELSYRLGRKVTLAELGTLTAQFLGRPTPFTAASVSRWESGAQVPTPSIIAALGQVTGTDPGWLSHGARSAAPAPRGTARGESNGSVSGIERPLPGQGTSIRLGSPPKS